MTKKTKSPSSEDDKPKEEGKEGEERPKQK
jgi:hypothetical protein